VTETGGSKEYFVKDMGVGMGGVLMGGGAFCDGPRALPVTKHVSGGLILHKIFSPGWNPAQIAWPEG